MLVAWPVVTGVKRVPSSTPVESVSTAAEVGALGPQIGSGAATMALALVAVHIAAPVTDSVRALASASPTLDPRRSRARRTKVVSGSPFALERFGSVKVSPR